MDVASLVLALSLNVRSVGYTVPAFLADTTHAQNGALMNPCGPGLDLEGHPVTMRLYGAKAYQGTAWQRLLLRTHLDLTPGARDTFLLYDTEPWSYWVVPVNQAGEGCESGITVGVPNVGVPDAVERWRRSGWRRFDIQGRRMEPTRSGVYYGARDTTVIR